jgi:uncharacterized protein (TIGR00255 family)
MLTSMTGFGQAQRSVSDYRVQVEIRSVNHRYCEVAIRLPREWASYEESLKKTIQQSISRGRVDVYIHIERTSAALTAVEVNWPLIEGYREAARQVAGRLGVREELSLKDLLSLPDSVVLREQESEPDDRVGREIAACLEEALSRLMAMRRNEGAHLQSDLLAKLEILKDLHRRMSIEAPRVVADYRNKLRERIAELLPDGEKPDENRLALEVALFADKCSIDEELTRLGSHFQQLRSLIELSEPVGRRIDFLIQEMNREVNTIGSKANQAELIALVVAAKSELEKIREQAQNIE